MCSSNLYHYPNKQVKSFIFEVDKPEIIANMVWIFKTKELRKRGFVSGLSVFQTQT